MCKSCEGEQSTDSSCSVAEFLGAFSHVVSNQQTFKLLHECEDI